MTCTFTGNAIVCHQPDFKPGDPCPAGYLAWQEWAAVQHKAGLRQKACGHCGKWKYPQELSDRRGWYTAQASDGSEIERKSGMCNDCSSIKT